MHAASRHILGGLFAAALGLAGVQELHAQQQASVSPATEYRKVTMQSLGAHRTAVTSILDGKIAYPQHLLYHASALKGLAMSLSDIFPEGSAEEGSRSLPVIWENKAGFAAQVQTIQAAATALERAAMANDMAAARTALGTLGGTCGSCHREFRRP